VEVFHDVDFKGAKAVEAHELEDFLADSLEDDFRTKSPEGELETVATRLLDLYRQCSAGNYAAAHNLISSYRPPPVEQSRRLESPGAPTPAAAAHPAAAPQPQPQPQHHGPAPGVPQEIREPPVDEWITVSKTGRGKKGGK